MTNRRRRRVVYQCDSCGVTTGQWMGRCPACGEWNTLQESVQEAPASAKSRAVATRAPAPVELSDVSLDSVERLALPFPELNRVLGGGIVPGSAILLGGEPGIGKSTLLLQIADAIASQGSTVIYGAGEESPQQIKLRAERLGLKGRGVMVLPETDLSALIQQMDQTAPRVVIIDSIQTLSMEGVTSSPGSVTQVRECASVLTRWAREHDAVLFLAGHVTKDGAIAGPRVLEHIVDVVLYLEGDPASGFRLLRGEKNRFGSTQEIALLQMGETGLREISDPSQALLNERARGGIGSVVVPTLEGSRPLLIEVQALVGPTALAVPRRSATGIDVNRLHLVSAILGRRLRVPLFNQDILINVPGGLRVSETAVDLGVAMAILSNLYDHAVDDDVMIVGEVGLSGEVRRVGRLAARLAEGARLGFQRAIAPPGTQADIGRDVGVRIYEVATLAEAANQLGLIGRLRDDDSAMRDHRGQRQSMREYDDGPRTGEYDHAR